jgi:cephalosporin-C deacetylase-like acetyl esterase
MELPDYPEPSEDREYHIHLAKDLGRTLDYLATRPDIQADKVAYHGVSWGGAVGPILTAIETRFSANLFLNGGFPTVPLFAKARPLPEIDPVNHAPRVKAPTLMINGRDDFLFPLGSSQIPMFRLLGTPAEHKRHILFDSGHMAPVNEATKLVLQWLDKYLGPVK